MLVLLPPILVMGNNDFHFRRFTESRAWFLEQWSDLVECVPSQLRVDVNTAQITVTIVVQCNVLLT